MATPTADGLSAVVAAFCRELLRRGVTGGEYWCERRRYRALVDELLRNRLTVFSYGGPSEDLRHFAETAYPASVTLRGVVVRPRLDEGEKCHG